MIININIYFLKMLTTKTFQKELCESLLHKYTIYWLAMIPHTVLIIKNNNIRLHNSALKFDMFWRFSNFLVDHVLIHCNVLKNIHYFSVYISFHNMDYVYYFT